MTGISAAISTAICFLLLPQPAPAAPDAVTRIVEQAVLSAYKRMEEADRKGDGQMWLALRNRATQAAMSEALKDTIRKGGHSRPSVRYEPLATRVSASRGVILGMVADPEANTIQYDAVLFVVEDGAWKVAREQWNEKPFDRFVLYAMLEPPDGAFMRDGAPWKSIPYASHNADVERKEDVTWNIQATFDESFVYVRFEAALPLPAAGSKVRPAIGKTGRTGGPASPPPMRIKCSGPDEYAISVSSLVSTAPAFDAKGRAAGDRYSVGYTLFVKNGVEQEVFASTLGEASPSFLLAVRDRFIDVKIPLAGLGVESGGRPRIDLEEADSVMRVFPYHVEPYSGR
jgi:hypothetical protein